MNIVSVLKCVVYSGVLTYLFFNVFSSIKDVVMGVLFLGKVDEFKKVAKEMGEEELCNEEIIDGISGVMAEAIVKLIVSVIFIVVVFVLL